MKFTNIMDNTIILYTEFKGLFHSEHIFVTVSHDTKGHIVFQYHQLWQYEQKKFGWIAKVGQTTWVGQTATVSQLSTNHFYYITIVQVWHGILHL